MTHACNPLSEPRYVNVVDVLRHHVHHAPDRFALGFQKSLDNELQSLDYATLDRCGAIAARLEQLGARGRPVLLLFPPGLDFVSAFVGCLYAGVIAVPSYLPKRPRSVRRLESIAQEAQAALVLTTSELLPDLFQKTRDISSLAQACWLSTGMLDGDTGRYQPAGCAAETVACLQFTSGSTAHPKGVVLTHGNLLANSRIIQRASHIRRTRKV